MSTLASNKSNYDVIVIGAGHAGLSVSYYLQEHGLKHKVFERGRIGESWRSQRWDSFTLNSPNWINNLPGEIYEGTNPDGFISSGEFAGYLSSYADKYQLPVEENMRVLSLEANGNPYKFKVTASDKNGVIYECFCKQVVAASGSLSEKSIPRMSINISPEITQIHTSEYRNAGVLPEGAVLVVGSGQSGCQIVEDLLDSDRKVFLSTSMVPRVPRRYRGKDIIFWFEKSKFFDMTPENVPDPRMLTMKKPQISGVGKLGHTVSLQSLSKRGVEILGKLERVEEKKAYFQPNAAMHVKFGDEFSNRIKSMMDEYIKHSGVNAPPPEKDEADLPDPSASCASDISTLDLTKENIRTIIWTTGFTCDYSWINFPVRNNDGSLRQRKGISDIEGLYFIGPTWLLSRRSGNIFGTKNDAEHISGRIIENHLY